MKRLLIYCIFPAPYRTVIFDDLSKQYDVTVIFERDNDANRNKSWFSNTFGYKYFILNDANNVGPTRRTLNKIREFDLVGVYDYATKTALTLILNCRINHVPYFVNCDGSFTNRNFFKDMIKRFVVKGAKFYLASGGYAKKYFLTYGAAEEDIFIHNFTSINEKYIMSKRLGISEICTLREKLNLPKNRKLVLSVGQFTYRKGFDVLLKAWKSVPENYYLLLIGGGEDENKLKQMISNQGLRNVEILDYQPTERIYDYMKASDVFVLPTREDIWGLVVNEALAFGLPVVTTDRCIAGLEMIQNNKEGIIVEAENADELSKAIVSILESTQLEWMREQCIKKARDYTIEEMIAKQVAAIKKYLE